MTEVEGSIISHIHLLTMVHIIYTIDTTYLALAYIKHVNIEQDRQKCDKLTRVSADRLRKLGPDSVC